MLPRPQAAEWLLAFPYGDFGQGPRSSTSADSRHAVSETLAATDVVANLLRSPLPIAATLGSAVAEVLGPGAFSALSGGSARTEETSPFTVDKAMEERLRDYQRKAEEYEFESHQSEDLRIFLRFQAQLNWFSRRIDFIQRSIERARPYFYLVVEELEKQKLPLDLALLPVLESGYQPLAESVKGASGIWQFIPGTGELYGLKQNDWYDGRLDIAASTRAAATYLAHLQKRFKGDFLLALAGYNCGEGRVEKAMAANRASGLGTDFWSLDLPEETRLYVPRMLALSAIVSDPATFGLKLEPISNRPYLAKVQLEHLLAVTDASRLAHLSPEQFNHLNPGFIKGEIGNDGPYDLLLPRQNVEDFHRQLDAFLHPPEPNRAVPDPGIDVSAFALAGTGTAQPDAVLPKTLTTVHGQGIYEWEGPSGATVFPADAAARQRDSSQQPASQQPLQLKPVRKSTERTASGEEVYYVHQVNPGETAEKIAEYYRLSPQSIRSANKLKRRKQPVVGQQIIIPLDEAEPADLLADATAEKSNGKLAPAPGSQAKNREGTVRPSASSVTLKSLQVSAAASRTKSAPVANELRHD